MDGYLHNRACYCNRCRARGLMGPVVLITLGVLFLLSEFSRWHFHQTWPILLIAIGVVKVMSSTADIGGHVPPFGPAAVPPAPLAPPSAEPTRPTEVEHV